MSVHSGFVVMFKVFMSYEGIAFWGVFLLLFYFADVFI